MWQLILGLILLALAAILVWLGKRFSKRHIILTICLVLAPIFGWLGQQLAIEGWKKLYTNVFRINISSIMQFNFPGPLLYFYDSKFGKTISPIGIAFYIEVSNNKDIISRVYNYKVKARFRYDEGGELNILKAEKNRLKFKYIPSGNVVEKWHTLHSVGTLHDQIYFVINDDWTRCKRIDFRENSFDVLARKSQLRPGESIMGWIFLENPPEVRCQSPKLLDIEMTLTNSQGEDQIFVVESPELHIARDAISCGIWHILEGYYDLTKEHYTICPQIDLPEMLKQDKESNGNN